MDALRESFTWLTEGSILLIEFLALIIIVFATLEAFTSAARAALQSRKRSYHVVWLRYGHWLVAALTFQLAADILESALAPSWEDIGRLAAIALIRTFLNYFLERDLSAAEGDEPDDIIESEKARPREG
jgi:uncharacterized membrane protein